MRFASLGSGSRGNALVVEVGNTRLLLDCGFGAGEAAARLARLGLAAGELAAILVTHEHDDHIGGVTRLARRHELPVYLTCGTLTALGDERSTVAEFNVIDSHTPFSIGDIEVRPYPVPHDAREPAQFVFGNGSATLGVLTDTGSSTPHIAATLSGLNALVIECNHDLDMLENGSYPPPLKRRISGRLGHLDNGAAAALVSSLDCSRLQHFVAAHLSRQNNTPALARAAMAAALDCTPDWIGVADQDDGFGWREIK
ncbi:MAG: MBL fold metallo-hydrolase [Betaproteobacteria bacterium]|nr:MBL fold metallo-hydrolase [Betaproteobacteria bacterium]